MKRSLFIIAAAALVFASCADKDLLKKDLQGNGEDSGNAIGFTSLTEKVTKAENSDALYSWTFFDHQENFQVWARKNNQPLRELFDGTTVTVTKDGDEYTYKYAPDRYWDKLADNYFFYAAAPAPATGAAWEWTFNGGTSIISSPATISNGYFTIKDNKFSLNGVNLQSVENGGATYALKNVFKTATKNSKKDVDLLIADETPVERSFYNKANPEVVNLNFIHILSKLNITISTSLDETGDNAHDVDLLAFEVHNMPNTGSFDENLKDLTQNKKQIRWTLDNATTPTKTNIPTGMEAYYNASNDQIVGSTVSVPYTNKGKLYIVESLIIPQEIKYQRVALDAGTHGEVDEDKAMPYANYEAYEAAKHNDGVTRLTRDQFNALINSDTLVAYQYYLENATVPGEYKITIDEDEFNDRVALATESGTRPYSNYTLFATAYTPITYDQYSALKNGTSFKSWSAYTPIEGETDDRISESEFNGRVANATAEMNGETPIPYSNYTDYTTGKGADAVLTEEQFNALIENGAFVTWDYYYENASVTNEKNNLIDETTFNTRVAQATKEMDGETPIPYSNYAEMFTAYAPLTQDQYSALLKNGAFVTWNYYYTNAIVVPGETEATISETEFNKRIAEATKTPETHIPAYSVPSEPYFTITYSINGEVFTGNYNLAAAFLGMNNNQYDEDNQTHAITDKDEKFAFYEGWQNTLNIIIHPDAIKFTADIAEWSNNYETSYTIEEGNENR